MQKVILPPVLQNMAFQAQSKMEKKQYDLQALKEKAHATSSRLYHLFFGAKTFTDDPLLTNDNKMSEPDYFSSYE